jgi:hypothetical protein
MSVFDHAHEITNRVDLIRNDIRNLEARDLIFYRDYYFEAIKPVGSQIVAKARLVRHARRIDAEMPGYDLADLDADVALHGSLLALDVEKTNQRAIVA